MRAAGPLKRDYPTIASPEMEQVRRLMRVANTPFVQIKSAELDLVMRR